MYYKFGNRGVHLKQKDEKIQSVSNKRYFSHKEQTHNQAVHMQISLSLYAAVHLHNLWSWSICVANMERDQSLVF